MKRPSTFRPLWLLFLLPLGAEAQEGPKTPLPSAAEQSEAEKLIKDVFKDDYAKRTPADRQTLARKLLDQGLQSKDDPKSQFVLFREAREMASQAGDVQTAMTAVDEMAKVFAVEPVGMKQAVLANATKAARSPDEFQNLARAALRLADAAVAADDFDTAEKLTATALQNAKKSPDTTLQSRAAAKSKQFADFKSRFERIRKARETLASNPEDGPSNLAVGRYECLVKGNWAKGLPLLAKSGDPVLRPLAEKELADPAESADQAAIADGWWDLVEKEKDAATRNLARDHAYAWYQKSLARLAGLNRTKVEKRLKEYGAQKLTRGTWLDVSDPRLFTKNGMPGDPVVLDPIKGYLQNVKLQYPKGDFDGVTVRVAFDSTQVVSGRVILETPRGLGLYVDGRTGTFVAATVDQKDWRHLFDSAWTKQDESILTVLLDEGEFILYLNSQEMTRIKTTSTRISFLAFEAWDGTVKFDRIQLRRLE